jgi:hypothetical protein
MAGKDALKMADLVKAGGGSGPGSVSATTGDLEKGKAAERKPTSTSTAAGESVTEMMQNLRLTLQEATPFILEDEGDVDLPCPDWALVGKVLTPNTLHINTITAVMRPAWGNPKGLLIRSLGPNMFLAEFASEADRDRVAKGGPWYIGNNHAILLKVFDPRIKPEAVVFNELAVWARIMNLDFGLMNSERGKPLASRLGVVDKVDVDENGRAWGSYLRVRVTIDASQPIMRCVSVFSKKRNQTEVYDVMYENLPMYCFSCGVLGHSSLLCPTPAERDAEGKLPYNGDKLCVPDRKKKVWGGSSDQSQSSRGSWNGTGRGSGSFASAPDGRKKNSDENGEAASLMKKTPNARGASTASKSPQAVNVCTPGTVASGARKGCVSGQKRKQRQVYRPKGTAVATSVTEMPGILAITAGESILAGNSTAAQGDLAQVESHKKQRTTIRSADPAAAASQSRHPQ